MTGDLIGGRPRVAPSFFGEDRDPGLDPRFVAVDAVQARVDQVNR